MKQSFTEQINRNGLKNYPFTATKKKKKNRSWNRFLQYYKYRLVRLKENPHKIARGFASGVFAGCLPLMGLQFVISIAIAFLVKGNKFTALMGTWISNPFTYVPLFFFNFQVGKLILSLFIDNKNLEFSWESWSNIQELGTEITITLLLGSVIVGLFLSPISYYLILHLIRDIKRK